MTTVYQEKTRCAVCGTESEHPGIASTNLFGSSDLDTRSPQMSRSTIFAWVQRCPTCGYCAQDLSVATPQAASAVRSPEYARQLADPTYPDLANSFLCESLIEEVSGNYSAAAWSVIFAAWACDDAGTEGRARTCRNRAVAMIRKAHESGQRISRDDGVEIGIEVDLLRRAGRMDEASELIRTKRPTITDQMTLTVLAFQEELIAKADEACHTISEAFSEEGPRSSSTRGSTQQEKRNIIELDESFQDKSGEKKRSIFSWKSLVKAWEEGRIVSIDEKPKPFSWKSALIAAPILLALSVVMSIIGARPKPASLFWTYLWLVLTIDSWKIWKWKALLPYPCYLFVGLLIVTIAVMFGADALEIRIINAILNVGGLTVFGALYCRAFKKWQARKQSVFATRS